MPYNFNRQIVTDLKTVRTDTSRRTIIRIAVEAPTRSVAPSNPYAAVQEPPDATTDALVYAPATFKETRVEEFVDEPGRIVARRGWLEYHPMFLNSLRAAYAIQIAREPGNWGIDAVLTDTLQSIVRVLVRAIA